jgi:hypothetical protein
VEKTQNTMLCGEFNINKQKKTGEIHLFFIYFLKFTAVDACRLISSEIAA